jgi:hypothetical protein
MALKDLLISARTAIVNNLSIVTSGVYLFTNDPSGKYIESDFPYIVIDSISSGDNEVDTGRSDIVEQFDIAFKTFSKDVKNCLDIGNELQKMFLVSKLSLNNGVQMCSQKFSENTDIDPDKDIDGKNIFQNILIMTFRVNFDLT